MGTGVTDHAESEYPILSVRERFLQDDSVVIRRKKVRYKSEINENENDRWGARGIWRIAHRILGLLILTLGLVNICLGVFLAILPLPVWIIWYIYFGFLVLLLASLEIVVLLRRGCTGKRKSLKILGKNKQKSTR